MGILSSNDRRNIDLLLKKYDIAHYFDFIYTEKNIFSKDKKLKFILKLFRLRHEDIIYIGDEVRDIQAAKRAGINNIAVTWGYNNPKILISAKPTALVENPKQLIRAVKKL